MLHTVSSSCTLCSTALCHAFGLRPAFNPRLTCSHLADNASLKHCFTVRFRWANSVWCPALQPKASLIVALGKLWAYHEPRSMISHG